MNSSLPSDAPEPEKQPPGGHRKHEPTPAQGHEAHTSHHAISRARSSPTPGANTGGSTARHAETGQVSRSPITRWLTRAIVLLVIAGAVAQIAMSAFYLSVAHSPIPKDVPVGFVASAEAAPQVTTQMEDGGRFDARQYATIDEMTAAITAKEIYGGVDLTAQPAHLYVASAGGPTASNTLRTVFSRVVEDRKATQISQLTASRAPLTAEQVQALAAPPTITDVVPLPAEDSAGASIGLLIQALAIGATIASIGLGRIGPRTTPSVLRAIGHLLALLVYAVVSAGVVLLIAHLFGIVPDNASWPMFWSFALISLAITGSVAGLVALIGASGSALGTAYFLFGIPIGGASVLPEFLPTVFGTFGQALPTGAGVTLIRDTVYFPDAATRGPVLVLVAYAAIGSLIVLIGNAIANKSHQRSVLHLLTNRTPAMPDTPDTARANTLPHRPGTHDTTTIELAVSPVAIPPHPAQETGRTEGPGSDGRH